MSLIYSYAGCSCKATCLNDERRTKAISRANVRTTCSETKRKSFLVAVCVRTRQMLMRVPMHAKVVPPFFFPLIFSSARNILPEINVTLLYT
jgi:hypothetical protein